MTFIDVMSYLTRRRFLRVTAAAAIFAVTAVATSWGDLISAL
jgi:hypothetical protein